MASKDVKYDPTNFNKKFEEKDKTNNNLVLAEKNLDYDVEIINLPHKEPVERIILDIRDLFFHILNLVEEKEKKKQELLLSLKLPRYCCRMRMMSYKDLVQDILPIPKEAK